MAVLGSRWGGGSIAAWLAQRSGPTGHVLVTDIDPRFLATLDQPGLEVQRHDISADPLPAQAFDLIHARLVLIHVPGREQALQRLVTALKPGGWLVIEDFDPLLVDRTYPTTDPAAAALFQKMQDALGRILKARGGNSSWGRSLYRQLRAQGLRHVGMEGYIAVWEGGSPGMLLQRANFEQIRTEAVTAGFITDEEVAQVLSLCDDPDFAYSSGIMMTAWGRRP